MRSIGLDVGKHVAEVAISEPGQPTRSGGRISATPDSLRAFAATLGPDDQIVLEATTNTWPIVELLEQHAGRVVVSNPLRTRAIADAKAKTDTIDARTLAELLAADYLPMVWQPDPATRALRRRVARPNRPGRRANPPAQPDPRRPGAQPRDLSLDRPVRAQRPVLAGGRQAAGGRARARRPHAPTPRRPGG
jgi:hypothetical protein